MGAVRLPEATIRRLAAEGRLPDRPPPGSSTGPKSLRALQAARDGATRTEDWAAALMYQCRILGLPEPIREHRFHPTRRWRFDLAWPDRLVACEVDGGVYVEGRHTSGAGFEADCEKLSEAAALGWRVLRVTPRHVRDGRALGWLERALTV